MRAAEPVYYHREYANDVSNKTAECSWLEGGKRVALVALPFFSLYKPLSFPISLGMGALRTWTCATQLYECIQSGNTESIPYALLQTFIAVVALAGTIFAHPLGMLITTGHDIIVEVAHLIEHLNNGEYQKAMESCLSIMNNALYFAMFLDGGLELAIASLAMQILLGLYHSISEFKNGNNLEGVGHLLMAMVRSNQLAGQVKMLKFKWKMDFIKKELQKLEDIDDVKPKMTSTATKDVIDKDPSLSPNGDSSSEKVKITSVHENSKLNARDPIPENVLKIYQKHRGASLKEFISRAPCDEISLLFKHHLYRPDDNGEVCRSIISKRGATLDLIKICLPDRQFLIENPKYIDDLYQLAIKNPVIEQETILFFSNRDSVKNCHERDAYFLEWFKYEMRAVGASEGEWFEDFVKRKGLVLGEINLLISKFPAEVKRTFRSPSGGYFLHRFVDFLGPQKRDLEQTFIVIRYKINKPNYYKDFNERDCSTWGSFEYLISSLSQFFVLGEERGSYLLRELIKETFPSEDYRKMHANKLNDVIDFWALHTAHFGLYSNTTKAVEIFQLLAKEGIDLKKVLQMTKHARVRDFLREHVN